MIHWVDSVFRTSEDTWCFRGLTRDRSGWSKVNLSSDEAFACRALDRDEGPSSYCGANERISTCLGAGQAVLRPASLVRKLLRGANVSNGHQIYRYDCGDRSFYIPGILLINKVLALTRLFRAGLFEADFVDRIVCNVGERRGVPVVHIDKDVDRAALVPRTLTLLAWLALSPHARRTWISVLAAASRGRIGLVLPADVSIAGWVWGIEFEHGIFVQELLGLSVEIHLPVPAVDFRLTKNTVRQRGPFRVEGSDENDHVHNVERDLG